MATNFPTSLDTFTNPVSGNTLDSPSHSLQHSDANDAIEAIEGFLLNSYNPSFRNLIINGAMQVAQRGTSVASITTSGYKTADRWNTNIATLGTWTQSVENDAPTGSGFRKSLKMLCTTADTSPAASDSLQIETILEGQNLQSILKGTSSAKQLTLSFWVKSNVTGTYAIRLLDVDNSNRMASKTYTISASATWEKKTLTFAPDTTGAFDNDNAASLYVSFWLAAGSNFTTGTTQEWGTYTAVNEAPGQTNLASATNNYWQITGVQLEVGEADTPYEFKPIDVELRQCQRYYYRLFPAASSIQLSFGGNYSTTNCRVALDFPVEMRIAPTAIETSGTASDYSVSSAGVNTVVCNAVPTFNGSSTRLAITTGSVASGLTNNIPAILNTNSTAAYLGWSAEL